MTVANERGLNPKLSGTSSEELLAELAARRAILVSAMSAELAVWSQIAGSASAAAPLRPSPTSTGAAVASPKTPKAPPKPRRRKRRGAAKAQRPLSPAASAGNPRAKSASGKTSSEYALEVLAAAKGPLAPKDIAPRMLKAGWHTDSPEPTAVAVTTLKKLAAEGKVKKTEGKNEFRALRSSP